MPYDHGRITCTHDFLSFLLISLPSYDVCSVPTGLCSLMQEDSAISVKRRRLQDLLGRLDKAVKVLQNPTSRESITGI